MADRVRTASDRDQAALLRLSRSSVIAGPVSYCMDRSPDYFAFNRCCGNAHAVFVHEGEGEHELTGCAAGAIDRVYLAGVPTDVGYLGDLKVLSENRGSGITDRLLRKTMAYFRPEQRAALPIFAAVAAQNHFIHRWKLGDLRKKGIIDLRPVTEFRYFVIPARASQPSPTPGFVRPATLADLDELLSVWTKLRKDYWFARAHDAASWKQWLTQTPGMGIGNFCVAVDVNGRIEAFLGLWDQAVFRRMIVTGVARPYRLARPLWNATLAPALSLPRIPRSGDAVPIVYVSNFCVPEDRSDLMERLLAYARQQLPQLKGGMLLLGLDAHNPLCRSAKKMAFDQASAIIYADAADTVLRGPSSTTRFQVEVGLG